MQTGPSASVDCGVRVGVGVESERVASVALSMDNCLIGTRLGFFLLVD